MSDILTRSPFEEYIEKMMQETKDATENIKEDFALILNPKHKDIIPELWYKAGLYIPIVWSPLVEENKCYVVTDKNFVQRARVNIHGAFGFPGWLHQYEGEWGTDEKEKDETRHC